MNKPSKPISRTLSGQPNYRFSHILGCCLILLFCLSGCAGGGKQGHSPFTEINSLRLDGQKVTLDLGLRNPNTEAIQIRHMEFAISVDGTSLVVYKAASTASLLANGRETLSFDLNATPAGAVLLVELETGVRNSLPYELEGFLRADDDIEMKLRRKGFLYPVPGRPGQFR